jgi:hypothetical protein
MKRALVPGLLFTLAACSSPAGGGPDSGASTVQKVIGASGGTVTNGDTSVTIPAGALSADTTVTVTSTPDAAPPSDATPVGAPYTFGPEGQQFAQPVTVTLPFDASRLPAGAHPSDVVLFTAPAGTTNFVSLGGMLVDSSHVSAQTTHFSVIVAGVAAGSDGGTSGNDGGTVASDGGAVGRDGGTPASDGGSLPPDGGSVSNDGGSPGSDAGAAGSDAGAPSADGGNIVEEDGGPGSSDAGSAGSDDAGPPAADGGVVITADAGAGSDDAGSAGADSGVVVADGGPSGSDDAGSVGASDAGSASDGGLVIADGGLVIADGGSSGSDDAGSAAADGGGAVLDAGSSGTASCTDIFTCEYETCSGEPSCVASCVASGTPEAQSLANDLNTCIEGQCATADGGVCATASADCVSCAQSAVGDVCNAQYVACTGADGGSAALDGGSADADGGTADADAGVTPLDCGQVFDCVKTTCGGQRDCAESTCVPQGDTRAQSLAANLLSCETTFCYTSGSACTAGGPTCVQCLDQIASGACSNSYNACLSDTVDPGNQCSDVVACEETCAGDPSCNNTCVSGGDAPTQQWMAGLNACLSTYCGMYCPGGQCATCEQYYATTSSAPCYHEYASCDGVNVCSSSDTCTSVTQYGGRVFEQLQAAVPPAALGGTFVAGTYEETRAVVFTGSGGMAGEDGTFLSATVVISNVTDSSVSFAYVLETDGCTTGSTGTWNLNGSTALDWQNTCPDSADFGATSYSADSDGFILYQAQGSNTREDYFTKLF